MKAIINLPDMSVHVHAVGEERTASPHTGLDPKILFTVLLDTGIG